MSQLPIALTYWVWHPSVASSWVPAAAATVARPVRNLRRGRRVETSRCWAIWSPRERRVGRKWRTGGGLSSGFLGPILQGSVDSAERLEEAMGVTITLTAEDGQRLAGYRAAPPSAPRAGLVIVQEIFGVNSHIKKVCDGDAALPGAPSLRRDGPVHPEGAPPAHPRRAPDPADAHLPGGARLQL